jgi:hypothetical protein
MEHLVEPEKLNGTEINTDDELSNKVKKVVINEVKEISALKPDTPKIAVAQYQYKYLVSDTLTDSVVGLYPTNKIANSVIIELVKEDLRTLIMDFKIKILHGESIEENQNFLQDIKQYIYQLNTIEQSLQTFVMMDGKAINRYKIIVVRENFTDVDESNFLRF